MLKHKLKLKLEKHENQIIQSAYREDSCCSKTCAAKTTTINTVNEENNELSRGKGWKSSTNVSRLLERESLVLLFCSQNYFMYLHFLRYCTEWVESCEFCNARKCACLSGCCWIFFHLSHAHFPSLRRSLGGFQISKLYREEAKRERNILYPQTSHWNSWDEHTP